MAQWLHVATPCVGFCSALQAAVPQVIDSEGGGVVGGHGWAGRDLQATWHGCLHNLKERRF
jgi:hypothetical protein